MNKVIVIAGATGNLGGKIVKSLLAKGAEVRAIVRLETDLKKIDDLRQKGVKISQVDTSWRLRAKYTTISAQSVPPEGSCCS